MFNRNDQIFRAIKEIEKLKNNPAYQAVEERQKRMATDSSYRALMESTNRQSFEIAHQSLLHFNENRHLYRQISDLRQDYLIDGRTFLELTALRKNLARFNAELWLKSDLLNSDSLLRRFISFQQREMTLIPLSFPIKKSKTEQKSKIKTPNASVLVKEFYESRLLAEQDLAEDEQLIIFVKLGKKEFEIKDLAVEEASNKIVAFLADESETAFVYCAPFRVNYTFYKVKIVQ